MAHLVTIDLDQLQQDIARIRQGVAFIDQMVEDFAEIYRNGWTIDELLLHPREATRFCDDVRRKHGYFDVPDDIILRVILGRRKNP